MPQFDPAFFGSQIFWLLFCFVILYGFMSKFYLPRIKSLLERRKEIVEQSKSCADELLKQSEDLLEYSQTLKDRSSLEYKLIVEKALKEASFRRERAISEMKDKVCRMTNDLERNISNMVAESKSKRGPIINKLTQVILQKVFNNQLTSSDLSKFTGNDSEHNL